MGIKIKRALAASGFAAYPETARAITASVPADVSAALTARQLATLYRAMHRHWQKAIEHAERAAINEGVVWDARQQRERHLPYARRA